VRTQVAIVGAGPAGLLLGHLLHRAGLETVVLESRSRDHVERRVRAGVLEQGTVDLLCECGVGERLRREGMVHEGIELRFEGGRHRIDLRELSGGRAITVYGQQEVVKDLIAARVSAGAPLLFEVEDVSLHGLDGDRPWVRFRHGGRWQELRSDAVAGCDGSHGICRPSIPRGAVTAYVREHPFAWLGILAAVPPSAAEIVYCRHPRGFALHSMRSASLSRLYLQVDTDEDLAAWPDDRIWAELRTRLAAEGWTLREGPVVERGITPLRSLVVEPMRYGRLFLVGDAAHIVPPTGAKGMNLAVADVRVLAAALVELCGGGTALAGAYSETCLRRVWRAQHFSWWMTSMLHRLPGDDPYEARLQLAQPRYTVSSRAAAASLAENYVGLESVDLPAATPRRR
jgi:p-hydroxybenzoate 3-monooxygenase